MSSTGNTAFPHEYEAMNNTTHVLHRKPKYAQAGGSNEPPSSQEDLPYFLVRNNALASEVLSGLKPTNEIQTRP